MPRDFATNSLKMLFGTAAAQLIPIVLAPIFTRLYSSAEYGVFSAFVALSALLAAISTGRLDLAIMLPRTEQAARAVLRACVWSIALMVLVAELVLIAAHLAGIRVPVIVSLDRYGLLLPLAAGLLALGQALQNMVARRKRFSTIAAVGVIQQVVFGLLAIGAAVATGLNGLVGGRLVGYGTAAALMWRAVGWRSLLRRPPSRWQAGRVLAVQRQFPLFNLPYSLLGSFSRDMPVLIFTAFGALSVAGQVGLARTMLNVPVYLLSRTVSQVFYREAAEHIFKPRLERLFTALLHAVIRVLTPLAVLLVFWADDIFAVAFGEEWRIAGEFVSVMTPAVYLQFFTSWPERIYEVTRQQHVSFMVQGVFDAVNLIVLGVLVILGKPAIMVIGVYASIAALQQFTYLGVLCRIARFPWQVLGRWGRDVALAWVFWSLLNFGAIAVLGRSGLAFVVAAALAAVYASFAAKRGYQALVEA